MERVTPVSQALISHSTTSSSVPRDGMQNRSIVSFLPFQPTAAIVICLPGPISVSPGNASAFQSVTDTWLQLVFIH
jgi:hypothetical protein